jgi:hypothetical protein
VVGTGDVVPAVNQGVVGTGLVVPFHGVVGTGDVVPAVSQGVVGTGLVVPAKTVVVSALTTALRSAVDATNTIIHSTPTARSLFDFISSSSGQATVTEEYMYHRGTPARGIVP